MGSDDRLRKTDGKIETVGIFGYLTYTRKRWLFTAEVAGRPEMNIVLTGFIGTGKRIVSNLQK